MKVVNSNRTCLGTDTESNEKLYLSLERLTHNLLIVGPTGCGKTRLLLHIFKTLCKVPDAAVIVLSAKGDFGRMARDYALAYGLTRRLLWMDPADRSVLGYNPLGASSRPASSQAKSVREAIRAASSQGSFDGTPQLARFLYLCLAIACELHLSFFEALLVLRPGVQGSRMRQACMGRLSDPFLREALSSFEALPERLQQELAASTVARLEAFVCDPVIDRILNAPNPLNLGSAMAEHKIVIKNLEIGRPLCIDDVRLLGKVIVNDVIQQAFSRPGGKISKTYLILDEAHLFATADLCTALDMGRELGLHTVLALQHLGQLRQEDKTGYLYQSVMTCARNKIIFGGLSVEDLKVLTPEVMIDQFNAYAVKDEITSLELEPIESAREVITNGETRGRSQSENFGTGFTETWAETRGHTTTRGGAESESESHSSGTSRGSSTGHGDTESQGESTTEVILPDGTPAESSQRSISSGVDLSHSVASSEGESSSDSFGTSSTESWSKSAQKSNTEGSATMRTQSSGSAWNSSVTQSRSLTPFYEYKKSRVVSSRTFFSEAEFLTMGLQKILKQPTAFFAIKVSGQPARFLKAPLVGVPWISARMGEAGMERVRSDPHYAGRLLGEVRRSVLESGQLAGAPRDLSRDPDSLQFGGEPTSDPGIAEPSSSQREQTVWQNLLPRKK